mmetsp:Transcript_3833/g.3798  ORF Transcript_3833/g.3798 Transcript_3833/m.3798 type:complete len:155 (-) Transcript_3833:39-503(-)
MSRSRRITEIEQQMAHLEWLKAQNERAYRNTLEKTKVMHQNDIILKMSVDNNNERTLWMSSVIKDELTKPLVLSDAEIVQSKKKIQENNLKLTKRTENHLHAVRKFKDSINRRIELNDNTRDFLGEPLENLNNIESHIQESLRTKQKSPIKLLR